MNNQFYDDLKRGEVGESFFYDAMARKGIALTDARNDESARRRDLLLAAELTLASHPLRPPSVLVLFYHTFHLSASSGPEQRQTIQLNTQGTFS